MHFYWRYLEAPKRFTNTCMEAKTATQCWTICSPLAQKLSILIKKIEWERPKKDFFPNYSFNRHIRLIISSLLLQSTTQQVINILFGLKPVCPGFEIPSEDRRAKRYEKHSGLSDQNIKKIMPTVDIFFAAKFDANFVLG